MSYSLFKRLDQGISRHILDVPVTERMTSPPWHTTIVTSEHRKVFGGTAILPHIFDPQKSPFGARLGARLSSDVQSGRRLDPNLPPR